MKLGDEIIKNGTLQAKVDSIRSETLAKERQTADGFWSLYQAEKAANKILQAKVAEQRALIEKYEKALAAVESLINESKGVTGLHLNGDVALWSELREGGNNQGWLTEFDEALTAMNGDNRDGS